MLSDFRPSAAIQIALETRNVLDFRLDDIAVGCAGSLADAPLPARHGETHRFRVEHFVL